MIPIIWPYKMGSGSAKALARELGARRVYPDRKYRPKRNHLIVNWGNGGQPNWWEDRLFQVHGFQMLNWPTNVHVATDKIACLNTLDEAGVRVPPYMTDRGEAELLLVHHSKVFCRTLTRANSGRGIVIAENPDALVDAPLYTANVGKRTEFRVHVFNGQVIDFSQKKKMNDERLEEEGIEIDFAIRSYGNGWVFCREDVELPPSVSEQALLAIESLGLDFGAVDCYLTERDNVAGVFEVNTAPGLEGTTLQRYTEAIERLL